MHERHLKSNNPNMSSQADLKHNLRKLDFPACAKEALQRIEFCNRSKQNFAMQLISEFIFLERTKDDARKGIGPISQINVFQEFQLILVLIEFFSQPGPSDATRNTVFLSLFGSNLTAQRAKILSRLISTSISGSKASILSSAGVWMQQVGCTTKPSLEVAQNIIADFIIFSNKSSDQLKQLPMVAPHFAANLMTAVADLYLNDKRSEQLLPPDALLDVFTEWVSESPALCLASQQPLALPTGAIAMPVVTPLAGLIRWTVLAPLTSDRITYSILHLAILHSLEACKGTPSLDIQHLALILTPLKNYCERLVNEQKNPVEDACYQKCVERLAQAVQVAFASNCVNGNIPQLVCGLETLPPFKLMTIVINAHKNKI